MLDSLIAKKKVLRKKKIVLTLFFNIFFTKLRIGQKRKLIATADTVILKEDTNLTGKERCQQSESEQKTRQMATPSRLRLQWQDGNNKLIIMMATRQGRCQILGRQQ